ncbi:tetratricopeptide repeat protein [Streptomyces sp. NPDC098789]|uniref:tetratricopeptide repeat protein n=1 Tax=Streptomyces sp. NPDC098789 TaxID=3366098 RepID=UPI00380759F6
MTSPSAAGPEEEGADPLPERAAPAFPTGPTAAALPGIHQVTSGNVVSGDLIAVGNVGRDFVLRVPERTVPALDGIPAPARLFSGRGEQLESLAAALDPGLAGDRPVHVITGMPGVGKTELALQAAQDALRREGWFPGGVLFVDLFGYDPDRRMTPEQALAGFLRALGVPAEQVPADVQERARLYATMLHAYADAGRRLLVVLDNADAAEDVRLLRPSDGATAVLITSRQALAVPGARIHRLTELRPEEGVALIEDGLRAANGASDTRVAQDPESAADIVRSCGALPLALQIVTALLADQPDRPLETMAGDLAEAHEGLLDELEREEAAVRAAFDLSYRRLQDQQALLFRLLSINPGPDIATETAAALLDVRVPVARRTLEALHRAHLIEQGAAYGRWRMHDLLRIYAYERSRESGAADGRALAGGRLIAFYADHVREADARIARDEQGEGLFPDRARAIAWLEAELSNTVALTLVATRDEVWEFVLPVALRLSGFFELRRHFDEWILTARAGLLAAKGLPDGRGLPPATLNLGQAYTAARRHDEALPVLRLAAELNRAAGNEVGEANAANASGLIMIEERRLDEAYEQFSVAAALFGHRHEISSVAAVDVNRATCLARMGRAAEGREMLHRAVAVFRDEGNVRMEAAALINLAATSIGQEEQDDVPGASGDEVGSCRRAITVFEEAGDLHSAAIATAHLGRSLRRAGEHKAAAEAMRSAAEVFLRSGERVLAAEAFGEMGLCFDAAKKYRRAMEAYRRAETLFAEAEAPDGRGRMLTRIGLAYGEMRRPEDAVQTFHEAVRAHAEAGNARRGAVAWLALAEQLSSTGRLRESVRATHQVATLLPADEGELAGTAASRFAATLQKARAALDGPSLHAEALALFTTGGADGLPEPTAVPAGPGAQPDFTAYRARTLLSLGMLRQMRGQPAPAEAHYEEAETLFDARGEDHFAAVAANDLGVCLVGQGQHERALIACERALRRFRGIAEPEGEAQALVHLAAALDGTGRPAEAEAALKESIGIFEALHDERGFFAMNNLGVLYEEQGRARDAELWYGRSARGKCAAGAANLRRVTRPG